MNHQELKTLSEANISSIDLNYVSTNIEINGNVLTEASKYTDSKGNKELAADISDFTVDPATNFLTCKEKTRRKKMINQDRKESEKATFSSYYVLQNNN